MKRPCASRVRRSSSHAAAALRHEPAAHRERGLRLDAEAVVPFRVAGAQDRHQAQVDFGQSGVEAHRAQPAPDPAMRRAVAERRRASCAWSRRRWHRWRACRCRLRSRRCGPRGASRAPARPARAAGSRRNINTRSARAASNTASANGSACASPCSMVGVDALRRHAPACRRHHRSAGVQAGDTPGVAHTLRQQRQARAVAAAHVEHGAARAQPQRLDAEADDVAKHLAHAVEVGEVRLGVVERRPRRESPRDGTRRSPDAGAASAPSACLSLQINRA